VKKEVIFWMKKALAFTFVVGDWGDAENALCPPFIIEVDYASD
jgi:hypothetical protein